MLRGANLGHCQGWDTPTTARRAVGLWFNELYARALGFSWVWYIVAGEITSFPEAPF